MKNPMDLLNNDALNPVKGALMSILKAPVPIQDKLSIIAGMALPFYQQAATPFVTPTVISALVQDVYDEVISDAVDRLKDVANDEEFKALKAMSFAEIKDLIKANLSTKKDTSEVSAEDAEAKEVGQSIQVKFNDIMSKGFKIEVKSADYNLTEADIAFLKSGYEAVKADVLAVFGSSFTPDAKLTESWAALKAVFEAEKAKKESQPQVEKTAEEKAAEEEKIKEAMADILAHYVHGNIQGLTAERLSAVADKINAGFSPLALTATATSVAQLPEMALKALQAKDYGSLAETFRAAVHALGAQAASVRAVLDLPTVPVHTVLDAIVALSKKDEAAAKPAVKKPAAQRKPRTRKPA